jgi:hypothetical protein
MTLQIGDTAPNFEAETKYESHAHGWPWPSDVTRALVFLIVGLLFVFASVNVPA